MTFIEKRLNKRLVKNVLGGSFFLKEEKAEKQEIEKNSIRYQVKDFFKSGIKEIQKDTKKIIKTDEE